MCEFLSVYNRVECVAASGSMCRCMRMWRAGGEEMIARRGQVTVSQAREKEGLDKHLLDLRR